MKQPRAHILICAGFRAGAPVQGTCGKRGSLQLLEYLTSEVSDRGLGDVMISPTGCLGYCAEGPVAVVYPMNQWYSNLQTEDDINKLLDTLEEDMSS